MIGNCIRVAVKTTVEKNEIDAAVREVEEHARCCGQTEGRIRPITTKYRQCLLLARARTIAVVVAEIVIVPDGKLRHRSDERLHTRDASLPAQLVRDHLGRLRVGVHIVAEPEEQIGSLTHHAIEDLLLAIPGVARTGTEGHAEVGRPLRRRLRRIRRGLITIDDPIDEHSIVIACVWLQPFDADDGDEIAVGRCEYR